MAEVTQNSSGHQRKRSPTSGSRNRPRIDMTAMVDVAFLLLTFFVLTATIQTENVLELVKPPPCEGTDCTTEVGGEKMLTLILDENDRIHYYHGIPDTEWKETNYAASGVRRVLLEHINRHPRLCSSVNDEKPCWDPIVVIKPRDGSRYENLIDLMDELDLTGTPKYALADFTMQDSLWMQEKIQSEFLSENR